MNSTPLELKVQPLMHFPFASAIARAGGFSIRLKSWDGSPGGHELAWLRYECGLWFYRNASGERVALGSDYSAADLLSWEWTTLAPDCDGLTEVSDPDELEKVRPFRLGSEIVLVDSAFPNPNGCATPVVPVFPPLQPVVSDPPGVITNPLVPQPGGAGGLYGGVFGSGFVAGQSPGGPGAPSGGSGGSGGSRGGGRRGRPRRPDPATNTTPTASLNIAASGRSLSDPCIVRGLDSCNRRCLNAPDPVYNTNNEGFPYQYLGATISLGADEVEPGSIWGYTYSFAGEVRATGNIQAGSSVDVDVAVQTKRLNMGASHSGSVTFTRGGRSVTATDTTGAVPQYCSLPPECGTPCPSYYSCELAGLSSSDLGAGTTDVIIPPGYVDEGTSLTCYLIPPPSYTCELAGFSSSDLGGGTTNVIVPPGYSGAGSSMLCYLAPVSGMGGYPPP